MAYSPADLGNVFDYMKGFVMTDEQTIRRNQLITLEVALFYFDELLKVANFNNREDWNKGLDLRLELENLGKDTNNEQ